PEEKRDDRAADKKWDTPSPCRHRGGWQHRIEHDSRQRREHDGRLLAGGLPAYVEALVARRGDLREIDGDAAELHPRREPLQQTAAEDEERRQESDAGVSRHA